MQQITRPRPSDTTPATRQPRAAVRDLIALIGTRAWEARLADLLRRGSVAGRAGRALMQRHAAELMLDRLRHAAPAGSRQAETRLAALAAELVQRARELPPAGQQRLADALAQALAGENTLVPLLHLANTALLHRAAGFDVRFCGLADGTPHDLLITRHGEMAEIACDSVSAESGRDLHRSAWFHLVDRIDPELQAWLAAHPGRYLLKITLPNGLRQDSSSATLAELHRRIAAMLASQRRADHDESAVLRLDPLLLAGAQSDELQLIPRLRAEFGPEAHLAVTSAGGGVFAMAARAGREDAIAVALRRRMAEIAPLRFSGRLPGILAMFVDDTDRAEWQGLRDRLELEGEARQFLATPAGRSVAAVSCASRLELFALGAAGAQPEALRFRNPGHPAARLVPLAPALLSTT